MEAHPELIELEVAQNLCHSGAHARPCYYDYGQPGSSKCSGDANPPCKGRSVIFVPKLEYLTWKLTQ